MSKKKLKKLSIEIYMETKFSVPKVRTKNVSITINFCAKFMFYAYYYC